MTIIARQRRIRGDLSDSGAHDVPVPLLLSIERPHTDDDHLRTGDGDEVVREAQPTVGQAFRNQRIKTGLEDRQVPSAQTCDAPGIDIETHDLVAQMRQASGGHKADVTGSDDGEMHRASVAESH